jgi:hypothetical protein
MEDSVESLKQKIFDLEKENTEIKKEYAEDREELLEMVSNLSQHILITQGYLVILTPKKFNVINGMTGMKRDIIVRLCKLWYGLETRMVLF